MERDDAVLKLVHPGRFVEIHRRPVAASEVMAKNPRHFVTRPDVFRFPWIVVRPESLLRPGSVFYIVPYHTLYSLQRRHDAPRYQELRPPPIDPWAADTVMYSKFEVSDEDGDAAPGDGGGRESCKLKSCLKKGRSTTVTRRRGRRVAFVLPGDDERDGRLHGFVH